MIFAVKQAKKRKPYNGYITMWAVECMLNIYEYYIECYARAKDNADENFKWCKRYYDEVFKDLEKDISNEIIAEHYNEVMRNAYMGNKLAGIIPCMGIFEFLDKLRASDVEYDLTPYVMPGHEDTVSKKVNETASTTVVDDAATALSFIDTKDTASDAISGGNSDIQIFA